MAQWWHGGAGGGSRAMPGDVSAVVGVGGGGRGPGVRGRGQERRL